MPSTETGLALIVLFIIPGFIMGSLYNRNVSRDASDIVFVVRAIMFSLVIHSVWAFWSLQIYAAWKAGALLKDPGAFYAWLVVVILLFPFGAGVGLGKAIESSALQRPLSWVGFSNDDRTETCWDWLAARRQGAWIVVEFRDGSRLGGPLGQNSRISFTPSNEKIPRDIFLEALYHVSPDGEFGEPLPHTRGAWINCADIKALKMF